MEKRFLLPAMRGKRGNPEWGRSVPSIPTLVTEFERQVRQLGLTKETCAGSAELRKWCAINRNRCYIPERLLEAWGISVDSLFSG
jgi:hypothetical protein